MLPVVDGLVVVRGVDVLCIKALSVLEPRSDPVISLGFSGFSEGSEMSKGVEFVEVGSLLGPRVVVSGRLESSVLIGCDTVSVFLQGGANKKWLQLLILWS